MSTRKTVSQAAARLEKVLRCPVGSVAGAYPNVINGGWTGMIADLRIVLAALSPTALEERCARMEASLTWYAERVADCRKISAPGNVARSELDADGGDRARQAIGATS